MKLAASKVMNAAMHGAELCGRFADAVWHALSERVWLSIVLYVLCCPFIEIAFWFSTQRFLRVRSGEPHRTRTATDTDEVRVFWTNVLERYTSEEVRRGLCPPHFGLIPSLYHLSG